MQQWHLSVPPYTEKIPILPMMTNTTDLIPIINLNLFFAVCVRMCVVVVIYIPQLHIYCL